MTTVTQADTYLTRFINHTNQSVFLTGKAGTGKTTLLRKIIQSTHKNAVVVAPTGIAALNAGGVTIHSMFQLPFAAFLPAENYNHTSGGSMLFETRKSIIRHFRMSAAKQAVLRKMELLIIDEVSMLRADLLDGIDFALQFVRRNAQPYGGVQVLFIGDLMQLPPVVKNDEWAVLQHFYKGKFFFHSKVVEQHPPVYIELSKVYRQNDQDFVDILNNLRNNTITDSDLKQLNRYVAKPGQELGHAITLTTHNAKADAINVTALNNLPGECIEFRSEIIGDFPEKIFPVDDVLCLKRGARVMFVKNDPSPEKTYYNGKTAVVDSVSENEIFVRFTETGEIIEVERYEWKNIRYTVNSSTQEIAEEVLGTFVHYPIKLAWAITVHKSQGLTFDRAALDVSQVFMPGQAYVALSRLRSLDGLILLSPLQMNGISNDADVMKYAQTKPDEDILEQKLQAQTKNYLHQRFKTAFDFSDAISGWENLRLESTKDSKTSIRGKSLPWIINYEKLLLRASGPASGFSAQLDRLFHGENYDLQHICNRVNAAFEYFFPTIDQQVELIVTKKLELHKLKKVKSFIEELSELHKILAQTAVKLLRVRKLADAASNGDELHRASFAEENLASYMKTKATSVTSDFFSNEAEPEVAKEKKVKRSTTEETLQLWRDGLSPKEIAQKRKLSPQTVYTHLGKLVTSKEIALSDLLSAEKIFQLENIFEGYTEQSLTPLKEKHGKAFTWDELKLFRAHQLSQ